MVLEAAVVAVLLLADAALERLGLNQKNNTNKLSTEKFATFYKSLSLYYFSTKTHILKSGIQRAILLS